MLPAAVGSPFRASAPLILVRFAGEGGHEEEGPRAASREVAPPGTAPCAPLKRAKGA